MSKQKRIILTLIEADNLLIGTRHMEVVSKYFHVPIPDFPEGYEFHVIGRRTMRLYHINGYDDRRKIMTFSNLPAKNFEVLGSRYRKLYGRTPWQKTIQWVLLGIVGLIIIYNLVR